MDLTSPHMPYILGAFAVTLITLMLLTLWSFQADRKAMSDLGKWKSDEAEA
ncbi:MAG: heme exporter protein CcmD [Alphaproteobacteria bacterium]|jgi:heme exporter protein D|nr:heme exporter protein CcmD [Alphaproteobacteria bacterium]